MFQDGYLLQVDAVFGPRAAPIGSGFGAPVGLLQAAGVELLGGAWTGRLWAVGSLFLAGFAPMVLLRRSRWFAQAAAGVLAVLNPWVYDRFVEGQGVLNAASGLFLWIAAWEGLEGATRPAAGSPARTLHRGGGGVRSPRARTASPSSRSPLRCRPGSGDIAACSWSAGSLGFLAVLLAYPVISFFVDDERGGYATVQQFTRRLRVLPLGHERRLRPDPEPDRPLRLLGERLLTSCLRTRTPTGGRSRPP